MGYYDNEVRGFSTADAPSKSGRNMPIAGAWGNAQLV